MIAKTLAVALALSAAAAPAFADCAGHKMKTDTSAQTTPQQPVVRPATSS
ncbi:hypothetical protein [Paracoccus yeei]|nr:hypothetical protein [Paracoccus yeei]